MTATCPRALRAKKIQQQTDPRGEDKKEKQHFRMNIRNVYISAETQLFSNKIHLRIVKL